MAYTFQDCWRFAALHVQVPDILLVRGWTQWAYDEFCNRRGWSHLRAETAMSVFDQKVGTATFAIGSPTVQGVGLVFAATDVGRAIRISSIPLYSILAVNVGLNQATLSRNYTEASGTSTATVLDAYVTLPEDLHRFIAILDPQNKWRLRYNITVDQLNRWDPGRTSTGNARLLVNNMYSPVAANKGQPRYELYPYQTSARSYPVFYYRKGEVLADTDTIIGPLARVAQSLLLEGVLSRAALWPGTVGQKNPYFSLQLAKAHTDLFEKKIDQVYVTDEELYFEGLPLAEFQEADYPWNAAWLQANEPYLIG